MEIRKVGVVGFGTMGQGIAQVCAQAGYQVVALEANECALEQGMAKIDAFMSKGIIKNKVTPEEKEATLSRIKGTTTNKDLLCCQLIIEAVPEKLSLKKEIFKQLDELCLQHTVIATNTSSLSVTELAAVTKRPEQVLGIHFFNPVPLMKLVEIVVPITTAKKTVDIAKKFINSLGKVTIIAKDTPGFIVNYLQYPFRLNAIRMLESGIATKEDIDTAAKLALGHPLGPLELQDYVGLDVTYEAVSSIHEETKDPLFAPPVLLKRMVAAGYLGRKTGKGFYDYTNKET
ncbi:MAG: 3-hydroxyacyl-CoA dehydrogenase family protein [bacterium]|jgi:3-hydroxybutyryl-CoA dehydrogenase